MPKQPGQRPKLLLLMHILYQQTDEDHRLSVTQLTEQLAALGIPCERKSIYSDIETCVSWAAISSCAAAPTAAIGSPTAGLSCRS